jgi:hypothetical protein
MTVAQNACPKCAVENPMTNSFCELCGELLASASANQSERPALQWKWVAIGGVAVAAAQLGVGVLVGLGGGAMAASAAEPGFLATIVAASCVAYLLAGAAVGYLSPGLTLKEPALGAAAAITLFNLATGNPAAIGVGWILPFGLTLLGAKLGEKLQAQRAQFVSGARGR